MMAQAGHPVFDSEGILQRGVILRHLALPGHVDDSFAVLDQMAAWNKADPGCFLPSVMSQYTPFYQAADHASGGASPPTNTAGWSTTPWIWASVLAICSRRAVQRKSIRPALT